MRPSLRVKTAAKALLCGAYKYSGAARLQEQYIRARGWTGLAILLFHRVTDEIPQDGLTVSVARFRRMCRMLRRSFNVVPLGEAVRIARDAGPIPPRTVAITFDDTYFDNRGAAEILAEHGLPACFFICSGLIGTDHVYPWDAQLGKRLANLSWDDVKHMADLGFEFGSHTIDHPNMAQVSWDEARRQLVESRKTIEDRLGRPVRWFAYPFGKKTDFPLERVPLVREAGYEAVFASGHGIIYRGQDYPILPRESVPSFHSVLNLELHLKGCLHWVYTFKKRSRPAAASPTVPAEYAAAAKVEPEVSPTTPA